MMKWWKMKVGAIVLAMLASVMIGGMAVSAANTGETETPITIKVTGRYGQTEARDMLKMINEF